MKIMIFDTETTSLNKPFCYNVGYVIADTDTKEIIEAKDFVAEQIWHNLALFSTAYYAEKRQLYVKDMRSRKTRMMKFGRICQEMIRDIKKYNIQMAFAYNSDFDERVFDFNCDWFKCINPFDTVEIKDIRGFAHHFIIDDEYKEFCEENNFFSDSGNYSTTAECMYRFITDNPDFIEDHTALSDSTIEWTILDYSVFLGADLNKDYKAFRSIPRKIEKTLKIVKDKKTIAEFDCEGYTVYKKKDTIKLK